MTARIFKPAKNAMQSGKAKTKEWQLDYEPEKPRVVEPLMGWTSSAGRSLTRTTSHSAAASPGRIKSEPIREIKNRASPKACAVFCLWPAALSARFPVP